MSGYILCQTQKAKIPYYIENISTNVYSLEELCYYFYHNLYLVDESILNEQLCRWLQEELNLPKLAAKLRSLFTRNFSRSWALRCPALIMLCLPPILCARR